MLLRKDVVVRQLVADYLVMVLAISRIDTSTLWQESVSTVDSIKRSVEIDIISVGIRLLSIHISVLRGVSLVLIFQVIAQSLDNLGVQSQLDAEVVALGMITAILNLLQHIVAEIAVWE